MSTQRRLDTIFRRLGCAMMSTAADMRLIRVRYSVATGNIMEGGNPEYAPKVDLASNVEPAVA
jgi:hypothetical protein